ncbi:MAG: three-Cys-motif partner protein TcmP [Nannocystaceae bacterium]
MLKHLVLEKYLDRWSHKIGSRATKMWFVDCFSGPWKSRHQLLKDTSIEIGLGVLTAAQQTWEKVGRPYELGAVFVEKDPRAFAELERHLHLHYAESSIDIRPICGSFGDHVGEIDKILRDDPAFIFVDPTGFKGAAMGFIRPLLVPRMRDVLVNVMYDHANRFQVALQEHLLPFFGLTEGEIQGLSEDDLFALYRRQLKAHCALAYAADLRIPHATRERTWFGLVVGGKDKAVLEVFRDVEHRVMGEQAGHARDEARRAAHAQRTGGHQLGIFSAASESVPMPDDGFAKQNADDRARLRAQLLAALPSSGWRRWQAIWPRLLEEHHVTLTQLNEIAAQAAKDGLILIDPWGPRRRRLHDGDRVRRRPSLDPNPGA